MTEEEKRELVEAHVDWFLEIIRPLLISFMIHGIKHGDKPLPPTGEKGC